MSRPLDKWYSLPELDQLAARGAVVEGKLAVGRLRRLADLVSSAEGSGSVRVRLRFRQPSDVCVILDVRCEGEVELVCQRCLEPMTHVVDVDVTYGLLEQDTERARAVLAEGVESYALDGDRFCPALLIEDELIVSLPLVARHAGKDECGSLTRKIEAAARTTARKTDRGNEGPSARERRAG